MFRVVVKTVVLADGLWQRTCVVDALNYHVLDKIGHSNARFDVYPLFFIRKLLMLLVLEFIKIFGKF